MIESIRGSVGAIGDEEVRLPLRRAVLAVGAREKPWAAILSAMIDKSVRYMIARPAGRLIDRIDVAKSDELDMALKCTFDRRQHAGFAFASKMRQRDAIELLNIDPSRYQDIAKQLPASVFGSNKTLVVDEILKVAAHVIDAREAQQRWGIRLDRNQMIDGGIGWVRDDIERLHSI